jgi:hypothetical protein
MKIDWKFTLDNGATKWGDSMVFYDYDGEIPPNGLLDKGVEFLVAQFEGTLKREINKLKEKFNV